MNRTSEGTTSSQRILKDVAELKRLAEAATPGPWRWSDDYQARDLTDTWTLLGRDGYGILSCDGKCNSPQELNGADAEFIIAANPAVILELLAQRDELLAALEFYADESRYHGPNQSLNEPDAWSEKVGLQAYRLDVTRDGGVIARAAIAKAVQP